MASGTGKSGTGTRQGRLRLLVQVGWGALTNAHVQGFIPGNPPLYRGPLKSLCVPGMNCYSCPGALGACPIGSLQSVLTGRSQTPSAYVFGLIATFGLLVGRFICGWLCLFGLVQELLYKIPTPKLSVPERLDHALRYFKYVVLAVFVLGLPFVYRSDLGLGVSFFCKFLCPVGTLEAGIPLVILESGLRSTIGALFGWKVALLVVCVAASILIYRPFCKYVCPLGAFYSLFQKVSLLRMRLDSQACVSCGACARACKMGVNPQESANHAECIRCGACVHACPTSALSFGLARSSAKLEKRTTEAMPEE